MKTIYLCGGINNLSDSECKDWREWTKFQLKDQYEFLDPMRRDYRGREAESVKEIVELDKLDIDQSDVLLVNANRPSWGTAMEIMYAFGDPRAIDILIVCDSDKPSPWLIYHSDKIFKTFDEAIEFLKNS
jgi:nucleoside 2-deoxyribosyltransferase